MDIETKLQRFSDVVRKEAEELKSKKMSVLDQKYEAGVAEFEQKTRRKYQEMKDGASLAAERRKQKSIAQKNAEEKRALILKRTEYIDAVFDGVFNKLDAFFKSPEYEELIVGYIESYRGDSETTAYIMSRDSSLRERIAQRTGVNVTVVDEDFLGGVRIALGKSRIADLTLKRRFESEKAAFNKIRI